MSHDLLVTQDFPPRLGGVARFYQRVAEHYPAGELTVLAPIDPAAAVFDASQPYPILRKKFWWRQRWLWPRWWPLVWQLFGLLSKKQIRAIIVGQVLPVGTAVAAVAWFFHVPYVVFTHGMDIRLPQHSPRKKIAMLRVLRGARAVIANSEYTKSEIMALGVPEAKVRVITPGSDQPQPIDPRQSEQLRQRWQLNASHQIILTVARLEERKGVDTVIMALAHIQDEFPKLKYLIVGTGPDEARVRQLVADYKLSDRVIFTGAVPDDELPAYYDLADLFVMPARQLANGDVEGFGIVYLEANAYGRPVIGGRSGGVTEAIGDGTTGLLVDPTTSTATIQAIRRLLTDRELRQQLGRAGQQRVQREFAWPDRGRAVAELMRSIV